MILEGRERACPWRSELNHIFYWKALLNYLFSLNHQSNRLLLSSYLEKRRTERCCPQIILDLYVNCQISHWYRSKNMMVQDTQGTLASILTHDKSCSNNPFVPNAPFLYSLKTLENRKVFWCFQEVEKGCIGNKWVKLTLCLV